MYFFNVTNVLKNKVNCTRTNFILTLFWRVVRDLHTLYIHVIFSRQASLARQAFLIIPLHGARYNTGKNAYANK